MILLGDCMERLKELEANSVDAVVTDPPYGWSFMNKAWDNFAIEKRRVQEFNRPPRKDGRSRGQGDPSLCAGLYNQSLEGNRAFQEFTLSYAKELYRVLKPGGHMLIFCGPRTYHRMASGVEDAGFQIRDMLSWNFGSGFPKSHSIEKTLERMKSPEAYRYKGWGTALKPAHEGIVLARKPLERGLTVAQNMLKWGVGGLNIDESRIGSESVESGRSGRSGRTGFCTPKPSTEKVYTQGRWPANLILDETAAEMLDEQSGRLHPSGNKSKGLAKNAKGMFGIGEGEFGQSTDYKDRGGASRFFYVAKASKRERNAGLEGMPEKGGSRNFNDGMEYRLQADGTKTSAVQLKSANNHPTVKPIRLMEYLCKLICPSGGTILDPFMGSGSTGVAAFRLGFKFIGIEMNEEYLEIARKRIAHAKDSA